MPFTVKVIVGATPSSRRGRRSHETAFHLSGARDAFMTVRVFFQREELFVTKSVALEV